jgi:hypothetical protein
MSGSGVDEIVEDKVDRVGSGSGVAEIVGNKVDRVGWASGSGVAEIVEDKVDRVGWASGSTGKGGRFDLVVSVAAVIVSLCPLGVI